MIKSLYSIFDKKAVNYGIPMLFENAECAKREVSIAMLGNSLLKRFPDDYQLVCIGEYDSATGELHNSSNEVVCELSSLVIYDEEV